MYDIVNFIINQIDLIYSIFPFVKIYELLIKILKKKQINCKIQYIRAIEKIK